MSNRTTPVLSTQRSATMFPVLTAAQIARISPHGSSRQVHRGEVLAKSGEHTEHCFIVITGEIEVVRPKETSEELIAVFQPGMFTGEVNMLSGRRSFVHVRVTEPGEVID